MKEPFAVLGVLTCLGIATIVLYQTASVLSNKIKDGSELAFPSDLDELRAVVGKLKKLKEEHFYHVLLLYSLAYLYKQTFAIPGSVFMNVVSGALFGLMWGLPLVCLLTATGASMCYLLSYCFGKDLVVKYFGHRIKPIQDKLTNDQQSLLLILVSLRLFPMSPNWFLNMTSPILGIPLPLFFVSVFVGLIPYNYLCVQTGLILSELHTLTSVVNLKSAGLLLIGTAVLMGVGLLLRKKRQQVKTE